MKQTHTSKVSNPSPADQQGTNNFYIPQIGKY